MGDVRASPPPMDRSTSTDSVTSETESVISKSQWQVASKTSLKAREYLCEGAGHTELARGAVKIVLTHPKVTAGAHRDTTVIQVAQDGVVADLLRKAKELREEAKTMDAIREKCAAKGKSSDHLAVDYKTVSVEKGGKTREALQVARAEKDFEGFLRDPNVDMATRLQLVGDLLDGLDSLHAAGYYYGDMKPENCLVYKDSQGNYKLKIADFGKTKETSEEGKVNKGNPRFAAPEGKSSQKADVAAVALVMARCLEEMVLNEKGDPLVEVNQYNRDTANVEKSDKKGNPLRRGIESFICLHSAFKALDGPTLTRQKRRVEAGRVNDHEKERQTLLKIDYFQKITETLVTRGHISQEQKNQLDDLFEKMSETDPAKRMSAAEAKAAFSQIAAASIRLPSTGISQEP